MLKIENIIKDGETVKGLNMYSLVDPNGKIISKMYCGCLDYSDAVNSITNINEKNIKAYGIKESLEILKKRGF